MSKKNPDGLTPEQIEALMRAMSADNDKMMSKKKSAKKTAAKKPTAKKTGKK